MCIVNQAKPADILKLHKEQGDSIFDDGDNISEDEDDEFDEESVSQETSSEPHETSGSDTDDKQDDSHTNTETKDTNDGKPAIIKKQKVVKKPRGSEYKLIRYIV